VAALINHARVATSSQPEQQAGGGESRTASLLVRKCCMTWFTELLPPEERAFSVGSAQLM
jgi:hypothetical protein